MEMSSSSPSALSSSSAAVVVAACLAAAAAVSVTLCGVGASAVSVGSAVPAGRTPVDYARALSQLRESGTTWEPRHGPAADLRRAARSVAVAADAGRLPVYAGAPAFSSGGAAAAAGGGAGGATAGAPVVKTMVEPFRDFALLDGTVGAAAGLLAVDVHGVLYSSTSSNALGSLTPITPGMGGAEDYRSDRLVIFRPWQGNGTCWAAFGGAQAATAQEMSPAMWTTCSGPSGLRRSLMNGLPHTINSNAYQELSLHPTRAGWAALVAADVEVEDPNAPGRNLYVTQDFGNTWTLKRSRVYSANWCHAGHTLPATAARANPISVPETRICFIADLDTNEADGGGSARFAVSSNLGETGSAIVPIPFSASSLVFHPLYTFVAASDDCSVEGTHLYVSADGGLTFDKAHFPADMAVPYFRPEQLLDDRHGVVWVGIDHTDTTYSYGNQRAGTVYSSDATGLRYAAVLESVSVVNNWWDVSPIAGIDGALVANILVDFDAGSRQVTARTVATWNLGADWHPLVAPQAETSNCVNASECNLHLFGKTTWLGGGNHFGDIEAGYGSAGVVLASGNVGSELTDDPSKVHTFVSRDAGESWTRLVDGSAVYEYSDKTGVVVVVPNFQVTAGFKWQARLGETSTGEAMNTFTLPSPMCVINLWTTDQAGDEVVLSGRLGSCSGPFAFYSVDLSQISTRSCDDRTDFEDWTLQIESQTCVLGMKRTFTRRTASGTACRTSFQHHARIERCPCAITDYECDTGFEPNPIESTPSSLVCDAESVWAREQIALDCTTANVPAAGGTVTATRGFRKIPLDQCTGSVPRYEPRTFQCTGTQDASSSPKNKAKGTTLGAVIGIAVTLAVVLVGIIVLVFVGIRKGWIPVAGNAGIAAASNGGFAPLSDGTDVALDDDDGDDDDGDDLGDLGGRADDDDLGDATGLAARDASGALAPIDA